jgi:hypothetical protein
MAVLRRTIEDRVVDVVGLCTAVDTAEVVGGSIGVTEVRQYRTFPPIENRAGHVPVAVHARIEDSSPSCAFSSSFGVGEANASYVPYEFPHARPATALVLVQAS